ncbi:MAG: type III pantothenate kinase [Sulfurovum sp.]|nr:type III pantothenate kinase [Sulfurovum sp.]
MKPKVLLADIGNSTFHIYDGTKVQHYSYKEAIEKYQHLPLYYICVNHSLQSQIGQFAQWHNLSSFIHIQGEYPTMGIDRKALCLSYQEGVFVDAGSAISLDVMQKGVYQGGCILLGLQASIEAYQSISPSLETSLDKTVCLSRLATTTKEQISYGIIASIKALIQTHNHGKTLYFTGGDGLFLSKFFENAVYDETLVFQGMLNVMKESKLC